MSGKKTQYLAEVVFDHCMGGSFEEQESVNAKGNPFGLRLRLCPSGDVFINAERDHGGKKPLSKVHMWLSDLAKIDGTIELLLQARNLIAANRGLPLKAILAPAPDSTEDEDLNPFEGAGA